jgi:hypothetical protein
VYATNIKQTIIDLQPAVSDVMRGCGHFLNFLYFLMIGGVGGAG